MHFALTHFALTKERQASTTQPPSPKYLLYTGKLYSPPFYFRFFRTRCKWVKLRRDKLQCLKSPLNTIVYGQTQDGANLFANKEGRKLNRAKITLYTVLPSTVFFHTVVVFCKLSSFRHMQLENQCFMKEMWYLKTKVND